MASAVWAAVAIVSPVSVHAQGWQELKGDHFIVYFTQDASFAQQVLNQAETYYHNIADDLGYPRASEFWTWEKRVKIYIYPDHSSFLRASGQPAWSQGLADYTNKHIISYVWSRGFMEALLPHEMAHLIFRDFVGFKGQVPLWLDEGVAQWEEPGKKQEVKALVKELNNGGLLLPIADMMRLDLGRIEDISAYYAQSASLVGFLIERFGASDFAHFCRQLRDGKMLEEALVSVYPTQIHDLKEFERKWKEYIVQDAE